MSDAERLRSDLCRALGLDPARVTLTRIAGGDSHEAACLESGDRRWFVKWNAASRRGLFEAELEALTTLAVDGGPVLPKGIHAGSNGASAWLITEWLALVPRGDAAEFGRRLARLHRCTQLRFGWHRDNHLGASLQDNRPEDSWPRFWWTRRLAPQLDRAMACGLATDVAPEMLAAASDRLLNHAPSPALVHGDLWGGNHAYLPDGSPVIFDPAPYFGDRETDLAMMRLFGGFDPAVYTAYEETWPLPRNAEGRCTLYQLYHLLNHFNLFGAGWDGRVRASIRAVLHAAGQS